jgi:hypothetical protein
LDRVHVVPGSLPISTWWLLRALGVADAELADDDDDDEED